MSKDNQKEKIPNVFNYKYFQLAFAVPLVLGFTLMIFIWCNDYLSLEWPSKKSLDTFLTYMSVPLWIMGASIPLATLAAANFRAIQFQENLKYQKDNLAFQKRNIERQEYEHVLDLYHKELEIFKAKLNSIFQNSGYKKFKPLDTTMLFTRFYKKPSKDNLVIEPDTVTIKSTFKFIEGKNNLVKALNSFNSKEDVLSNTIFNQLLLKHFDPNVIDNKLNLSDIKILSFCLNVDRFLIEISRILGISNESLESSSLKDIFSLCIEIEFFYHCIFDSAVMPKSLELEKENIDDFYNISDEWVKNSSINVKTKFLKIKEELKRS